MKPGNKKAVLDHVYFDLVGERRTPCFKVMFSTDEGPIEWAGYLSEAAAQRTVDTMRDVLGWNGDDSLEVNGDKGICLKNSNFNATRDYELVIEEEEYKGKKYCRVKWINLPGTNRCKLPVEEVRCEIAKLGLKALYLASKPQGGADFAPGPGTKVENTSIPF